MIKKQIPVCRGLNMKNRDLSFLDYMDKTQIIRKFY